MKAAPELSLSSRKPEPSCNKRRERYERAVALFEQGKSKKEIARRLGMSRSTVIAYVAAGVVPRKKAQTPHLGHLGTLCWLPPAALAEFMLKVGSCTLYVQGSGSE